MPVFALKRNGSPALGCKRNNFIWWPIGEVFPQPTSVTDGFFAVERARFLQSDREQVYDAQRREPFISRPPLNSWCLAIKRNMLEA